MSSTRRWGLAVLVTLLALLALAGGAIYWFVHTPGGAQLLLGVCTNQ